MNNRTATDNPAELREALLEIFLKHPGEFMPQKQLRRMLEEKFGIKAGKTQVNSMLYQMQHDREITRLVLDAGKTIKWGCQPPTGLPPEISTLLDHLFETVKSNPRRKVFLAEIVSDFLRAAQHPKRDQAQRIVAALGVHPKE